MASSSGSLCDQRREGDHDFMRVLVTAINNYILELLENPEAWNSLKLSCRTRIEYQTQEFFEFSDQSVLSNLYWGIESIESVIKENTSDERKFQLERSEQMLQMPALLNEDEFTAGIPNRFLVCFSYVYLSVLRKLQGDDLQVALHFLQALIVSPRIVWIELAEELCQILFPWCPLISKMEAGDLRDSFVEDFREKDVEEAIKQTARRYKDRLMYYQVMLYGQNTQWNNDLKVPAFDNQISNHQSSEKWMTGSSIEGVNSSQTYKKFQKIHPIDSVINVTESKKALLGDLPHYRILRKQQSFERKSIRDILQDTPSPDSFDYNSATDEPMAIKYNQIDPQRAATCEYTQAEIFQQKQEAQCLDTNLPGPVRFDNGSGNDQPITQKSFQANEEHPTEKNLTNSIFQKAIHSEGDANKEVSFYHRMVDEISADLESDYKNELEGILEDTISQLIFSKGLQNYVEEHSSEINIIYETLTDNIGVTHSLLKEVITDLLLTEISSSWEVDTIRASVTILSTFVLYNKSAAEEMKMKGLRLDHLVNALKHRVNEAAILIYLVHPSPAEIINLDLFPTLLEVVCSSINYKSVLRTLLPTPPVAALMIIEELITTSDHATNSQYLAQVSSPRILSALLELTESIKNEEIVSLASVLTKCMRFNGECREYVMQYFPKGPFICLMQSNNKQAWVTALELFHEMLCAPRSSVIGCLQLIQKDGSHRDTTHKLMPYLQQLEPECKLMAANFLLHLGMLDAYIDTWSSKMAQNLMKVGNSILKVLEKGLKSSIKKVSKDCLTTVAWIGCEIAKHPNIRLADNAILLTGVEKFLHPGFDLDERLLACLSIYKYASVKGMQKVIHFNEGVNESLRRLSNTTWMADELLKVAHYIQPYKSRISCVHTQILEVGKGSAAVRALTYYRGQLYSGHEDGSIKVWERKEHTASLVLDVREHRKAVTCFSTHESGNLVSSSEDKTVRVWKMLRKKLECIDVIMTKVAIESMVVCGQQTFLISKKHRVKVLDASRAMKDIYKRKQVKCMHVTAGKVYLGCLDSSIQELNVVKNREREIKEPTRNWRLHSRPINSISVYKDWLYSASTIIEGSHIKDWRTNRKPQVSIGNMGSNNLLAISVVEDFIYVVCSTSPSVLQIWLRGSHRKVGRLSAGSNITCLLAVNDMIICGTESGIIKGWIPF
uniref:E3 ubiquitin-protein ligase LIN-1 n=1 Tax=Kalanchoe fedtschenkoi TaxID=63787 RepID=A0A7N0T2H4_KALFE